MKKYNKNLNLDDYQDDSELINYLNKMFDSASTARKAFVSRARRNEELYKGDFLKPFNLPSYRSRIEPNIVHSIVETMISILTDRPAKVDILPKSEEQLISAAKAQEAVEWVLREKKAQRAINSMKRDMLTYGNGFLKIAIINDKIDFIVPDVYSVLVDPLATNLDNISCCIFATPTYVDDIKAKYGKDVPVEGKLDQYKSFVKNDEKWGTDRLNVSDMDNSYGGDKGEVDYRGGQALLREAWYYKDGKLRLSTWVGKILLQDEDAPYDFIPLVMAKNYPSAHSFYGKGEPEVVESLAVGSSIALSQGMDNLILQGNPVVIMSKSLAKIPSNRISDKPGNVMYVNGPHERIDRLPAGNISASTLPLAQSLIGLADQVSGVHDVTKGMTPGSVTASRAISQLNEASQTIIRNKEREVGNDAIVDMYKIILNLLAKNYPKTINIRSYAKDGSGFEFSKIQPYDLDPDVDFKFIPGSSLPESRASRRDEAINFLQLGLFDESDFWRWQAGDDLTREKLEEIAQMRAAQQQQMEQEMDILSNSTDEDEIMDSLLRRRELTGEGAQVEPEE